MNRRSFGVLVASLLVIHAAHGQQQSSAKRYTISGRVSDPHNLQPAEAVLMLGSQQGESFAAAPVRLQRDGTFVTDAVAPATYVLRMVRPPHIVVNAFLAMRGSPALHGAVAEGAWGGKFVLRNAFGPRVLRAGYTRAPGAAWWPSRVLLDGVDITNTPTDFSTKAESVLEVGFTQHPARIPQ
jgi:hypothetical protein